MGSLRPDYIRVIVVMGLFPWEKRETRAESKNGTACSTLTQNFLILL